ncbi:hypothetical protein FHS95_002859 [Sphingomonas naasensis]|uniref:Uncharacterized protein n=1 Tax=Sphingomonas naasensis TaxID=1344951 RepID=A0A4S1W7B6_9SPHN|nr:hypothetical protein [Sphingomonas naasensis]NIJ21156.1 hypothetical protein [Sphingomonas naasensis]TGX38263.1 hypothetical protein E5A74_18730 [Sphingomonas naasensis]
MRLVSAAAVLCAIALPAAAQSQREADAVRALNEPMVQEGIAMAMTGLAGIVLDTRVGPLARYADPDADIRPSDTLRDLERRRDPHFEAKLHDRTRRAVAATGAIAGDALAMSGELAKTADRLRDALAPLAGAIEAYSDDN